MNPFLDFVPEWKYWLDSRCSFTVEQCEILDLIANSAPEVGGRRINGVQM
jgi:hypothetical protein